MEMEFFRRALHCRRRLTKVVEKCRNLTHKIQAASIGVYSCGLGHVQPHCCLATTCRGNGVSPAWSANSVVVTSPLTARRQAERPASFSDLKSFVLGKCLSVFLDLGGCLFLNKLISIFFSS